MCLHAVQPRRFRTHALRIAAIRCRATKDSYAPAVYVRPKWDGERPAFQGAIQEQRGSGSRVKPFYSVLLRKGKQSARVFRQRTLQRHYPVGGASILTSLHQKSTSCATQAGTFVAHQSRSIVLQRSWIEKSSSGPKTRFRSGG
jgi:hypothetical protein